MASPAQDWVTEGYELVVVEEGPDWRLESGLRCRQRGEATRNACGKPSLIALNRGRRTRMPDWSYRKTDSWWGYCKNHMYGRWVEDGKVMKWIFREKTDG